MKNELENETIPSMLSDPIESPSSPSTCRDYDAASSMFQSNIQCMAYVLALKKELVLIAEMHEEESKVKEGRIAALMDIVKDQQYQIDSLQSAFDLKKCWQSLFAFHRVPADPLCFSQQHSNSAAAITMLTATVAHEMLAVNDGASPCLIRAILEKLDAMSKSLDATNATSEENFHLRTLLDQYQIKESLLDGRHRAREKELVEEVEHHRRQADDLRLQSEANLRDLIHQNERSAALQQRIRQLQSGGSVKDSSIEALGDSRFTAAMDLADLDDALDCPFPSPIRSMRPARSTESAHRCAKSRCAVFDGLVSSGVHTVSPKIDASTVRHVARLRYARGEISVPDSTLHSTSQRAAPGASSKAIKLAETPEPITPTASKAAVVSPITPPSCSPHRVSFAVPQSNSEHKMHVSRAEIEAAMREIASF